MRNKSVPILFEYLLKHKIELRACEWPYKAFKRRSDQQYIPAEAVRVVRRI